MLNTKMISNIFIFVAALSLQLLFSTRLQSIDVRVIRSGVFIKFSKSSPPIAALEDEKLGPLASDQMNRGKIAARAVKEISKIGLVNLQKRRIAFMKPLRILTPQIFSRTVRASELVVSVEQRETFPPINTKKFVESLPSDLRLRAEKVNNIDQWVQSDWSDGTVRKTLDSLIVAAGPPIVPESAGTFVMQPAREAQPTPAQNTGTPVLGPIAGLVGGPGGQAGNSSLVLENVVGAIEVDGGLALLGAPDQIRVFHRRDGTFIRSAQIDLTNWEFQIPMSREMTGELVAELRSESDRLLGVGRMNVADVFRMKKPILKLRADSAYTTAMVNSGDGLLGAPVPVSGVKMQIAGLNAPALRTNAQGAIATKAVEAGSTFEWFATKEGFWPTRTSGHADWPNQIMLFPNRMMDAMFGMIGIQKYDPKTGVIWGQVRNRGVPLEGAKVTLEDGDASPVYFSGPFPNLRLSGTSSNGYFAFLQLKPGPHQVKTEANGSSLPTKIVEVQESVVTTIDVSTSKNLASQVQTYEGVSGEPVTASVQLTGTHRVATATEGRLNLRFSEGVDPLMLDVFSGPLTLTSRISGDRFQKRQMVPVVKISWIEDLLSKAGVVHDTARSLVVGYIQGKDFEAELNTHYPNSFQAPVPLYFDAQGNPLPGSRKGIAGGGFVFTNLPEGFATVVLHGTDGVSVPYIHRLYLDSRVVGVMSKDLGLINH